jgi:hypothetical protein
MLWGLNHPDFQRWPHVGFEQVPAMRGAIAFDQKAQTACHVANVASARPKFGLSTNWSQFCSLKGQCQISHTGMTVLFADLTDPDWSILNDIVPRRLHFVGAERLLYAIARAEGTGKPVHVRGRLYRASRMFLVISVEYSRNLGY